MLCYLMPVTQSHGERDIAAPSLAGWYGPPLFSQSFCCKPILRAFAGVTGCPWCQLSWPWWQAVAFSSLRTLQWLGCSPMVETGPSCPRFWVSPVSLPNKYTFEQESQSPAKTCRSVCNLVCHEKLGEKWPSVHQMPDFGACRIKSTSCPHKTNCHGPTLLPTLPPHEACSSLAFLSLSLSFSPHFVLTPPSWVYTQVTSSNYPDLTETSLILQETFQTLRLSLVPLLRAPQEPWTSSFSRFH